MDKANSYWFVGASFGKGSEDQTPQFLTEGIWENGYRDKYLDIVRSIQPGDGIAIKSSYTRKYDLPFDSNGQSVSVMGIKAIGVVTKNLGDGRHIEVDWEPKFDPIREWYFHTNRSTVWRIVPGEWMTDGLIDFAFDNASQDVGRFRNAPFWEERYGDAPVDKQRFKWTRFYEDFAGKLIKHKNRRKELLAFITPLADRYELSYIKDKQLDDICPFTTMGMFNRGITDSNRKAIASELADFLGVTEAVPDSFEGIPILNNQNSWFFGFADKRNSNDIEILWDVFEKALHFSDSDDTDARSKFANVYDQVTEQYGVGWNLTMALYWVRPWNFPTLDSQSQVYITEKLGIEIGKNGHKGRCSAKDYLKVLDELELRFKEEAYPVHSFPDLSYAAWLIPSLEDRPDTRGWRASIITKIQELCINNDRIEFNRREFLDAYSDDLKEEFPNNNSTHSTVNRVFQTLRDSDLLEFIYRGKYRWLGDVSQSPAELLDEVEESRTSFESYSVENILADGCFIEKEMLDKIVERLRTKRNLILQGPPGTGKTWLAKRLAYALMGEKNEGKLRAVQFHPNLSYEDFVRGWRPSGDGKLTLVDGPFLEMINAARQDATNKHVIVIEEINRGNPAQIFGEMLTLLEADKRTSAESLELSYRRNDNERVFVPDNLYVIGTMNLADRSLALVDFALRRRFAFIDLVPIFGERWRKWVHTKTGIELDFLERIEQRLSLLNKEIKGDGSLGAQFRIGHSYVTPAFSNIIRNPVEWYKGVVETEIGPLLREYWFDDLDRARKACDKLIEDL